MRTMKLCNIEILIDTNPRYEIEIVVKRDDPMMQRALQSCSDAFTDNGDDANTNTPTNYIHLIQLQFNSFTQFINWHDERPATKLTDPDAYIRIEAIIPASRLDYMIETCDADVKSIEEI